MYGVATDTTTGPWGPGVFGVKKGQSFDSGGLKSTGCPIANILDGTSNTLMVTEGIVPADTTGWGGPMGMIIYGNIGGGLMTASLTPNSSSADRPVGPCPQTAGDASYKAPCLTIGGNAWWTPSAAGAHVAARSLHSGGVNAAMADGSVRFHADSISLTTWRSMATCAGGEVFNVN